MSRLKIRTAITVLAATVSVAGAVGPLSSAAYAQANTGGGATVDESDCADLVIEFNRDSAGFAYALDHGNVQGAVDFLTLATNDYQDARAAGCGWAQRVAPPHWPVSVIPPKGAVRAVGVS